MGDSEEIRSFQVKKFNSLKSGNNRGSHRLNAYPPSCTSVSVDTTSLETMRLFKNVNLPYWTKLLKIKANTIYTRLGEPCLISVY